MSRWITRRWPATLTIVVALGAAAIVLPTATAVARSDGAMIALSAHGAANPSPNDQADVVVVGADGSDPRNLTPGDPPAPAGPITDRPLSWSADGSRIAFFTNRRRVTTGPVTNVFSELYTMSADGGDQTRVAAFGGWPSGASWSPAGLIAFQREGVWVVAPDGSGERKLTDIAVAGLAWSPDGTRLLYVPLNGAGLHVVTAGGEPVRRWEGYVAGASWSPDGSRIAFAGAAGVGDTSALRVLDMNTGSVARLTDTLAGGTPSWSPDGRRIAFAGTRYDSARSSRFGIAHFTDVYTVAADGSQERRLTGMREVIAPYFPTANPPPISSSWEARSGGPTWWPDGSRLFFSRTEESYGSGLYMMNADGTCETEFRVPGFATVADPLWRPGRRPALPPLRCVELGLVNEPRPEPVGLGLVRYELDAINDGTAAATGVRLHVTLPAGAVLATDGGRCGGTPPLCRLPQLVPGERRTVTVTIRHTRPRRQEVTFRVSALGTDGNVANNAVRASVVVMPCERLGTPGDDRIDGTRVRDSICGRAGSDVIRVAGGDDYVHAGTGNDRVYGGDGRDTLLGREGRDEIDGGPSRDWIAAGGGNDRVLARDGQQDVVRCDGGTDVVVADPGDIVDATCERVHRRRP